MLRGEMGITKGHGRRGMPQEIAHSGKRNSPHNEPGREGMAGGRGSENPSVLRPRRLDQSHAAHRPTDARQNCGTFLFPNIKGGHRFLVTFLHQLTPLQTSGLAELSRICRANTQLSTV
jgi:hypothetical protein